MAFKNVHHFWQMRETVTRGVAHFFMTYLVTELIHKVFEFGHLNAINNLNAQIILKLNVGCWK